MPVQTAHGLQLEHPTELTEFRHAAVHFVRQSETWQPGVYKATDDRGREYTVTTEGGTKRYPVRIVDEFGNVDRAKTLILAAEWIARLAERRGA
jgi:hypothetical protein